MKCSIGAAIAFLQLIDQHNRMRIHNVPKISIPKLPVVIAALPIILLVVFPKGGIISITSLVPLIFITSATVTVYSLANFVKFSRNVLFIFNFFLAVSILFLISILLNQTISDRALFNGLKFFFFGIIFFSAYFMSRSESIATLTSGVKLIAIGLIFLQIIILAITYFEPTFFNTIWASDKTRGQGQGLRLTGSMYNPNTFGLMVINLYTVLIILGGGCLRRRVAITSISFALILLSGSRTSVLLFITFAPMILVLPSIKKRRLCSVIKAFLVSGTLIGMFGYSLFIFLNVFGENFSYVGRITQLEFSTFGDFALSVAEQSKRYSGWVSKWEYFVSTPGAEKWLIGLGVNDIFRVGDNDYFYAFWHWGALGASSAYLLYVTIVVLCRKADKRLFFAVTFVFLQLAVFGVMAETFFSWFHPVLFWVLAGVAYASGRKRNKSGPFLIGSVRPAEAAV